MSNRTNERPLEPSIESSPTALHLARWQWLVVSLLLLAHYTLGLSSVWSACATYDETAYVAAGYSYWQTGDFRLVPEHPPLIELWATIPLNFMDLRLPSLEQACWRESEQWEFGRQFFYELGNDPQRMLMAGRAMIGVFSVALGLAVYLVARRLFGVGGGLISLVLYAFAPEALAHGFLVTTDMAASLFFLLSVVMIWKTLHAVRPLNVVLGGLALAGLFTAKMSAVLILPMYAVLVAIRCISSQPLPVKLARQWVVEPRLRRAGVHLAVVIVQGLIVAGGIWVAHGARFSAFANATPGVDRLKSTTQEARMLQTPWDYELYRFGALRGVLQFARDHRLLPEAYLFGFAYAKNMTAHSDAFLNGERSSSGFVSFFPYSFLVKTTLPAMGILLLGVVAIVRGRSWRTAQSGLWPLLVLLVVYWTSALLADFNIGHRHLLPTYAPTYILAGAAASMAWAAARFLAPMLAVLHVAVALWTWPNYLSYFNSLAGGSKNAYRHLVDSSLDWGQDLLKLKRWLDANRAANEPVYLSYFGSGSPEHQGINAIWLPSFAHRPLDPPCAMNGGVYCISATMLQQVQLLPMSHWTPIQESLYQRCRDRVDRFQQIRADASVAPAEPPSAISDESAQRLRFGRLCAFLRQREPDDFAGRSILIYRLSEQEIHAALFGPPPGEVPDRAKEVGLLGDQLSGAGARDWAVELYRESLRLDPSSYRVHHNLAILLGNQKKYDEAIEHLRESIRLKPDYAQAHFSMAVVLALSGKQEEAVAEYNEALRHRPGWPEVHQNLILLFSRTGQDLRMLEECQKALRVNPAWPSVLNDQAVALSRLGRLEDAAASFREAARLVPNDAIIQCNLARALFEIGKTDVAISHYENALRIKPGFKPAAEGLESAIKARRP